MQQKTIRARIIDLVLEALKTCPSVPEQNVEIAASSSAVDLPSLALIDLGDEFIDQNWTTRFARLHLQVRGAVEGDGGAGVEDAINTVYAEVYRAASADVQWGGLAQNTHVGDLRVFIVEDASVRQAEFEIDLIITFSHAASDPAAQ